MSKNSSNSYGEAQKGVLRMVRVNCYILTAYFLISIGLLLFLFWLGVCTH